MIILAVCPACGKKLRLTDWRSECPYCSVNINYYDSNRILLEESEKAEIEHSKFQPKVDRAKAAYAGSKAAILRIVFSVLPILSLFLPLCRMTGEDSVSVNAITVYKYVSSCDVGALLSDVLKGNAFALSLLFLLLTLVGLIVSIVLILISLGKHGRKRVLITYSLLGAFAAASLICAFVFTGKITEFFAQYSAASVSVGAYVFVLLVLFLLGWNLYLLKTGIPINYKQCLIGGLPAETYEQYVSEGMSRDELNRRMLIALAELQERDLEKEEAENNG